MEAGVADPSFFCWIPGRQMISLPYEVQMYHQQIQKLCGATVYGESVPRR